MEFLGAMFKGIGDTFTAGANVNMAQIAERNQKRQIEYQRMALDYEAGNNRLGALLGMKAQDAQLVRWVVVAGVAVFMIIVIMKIWR